MSYQKYDLFTVEISINHGDIVATEEVYYHEFTDNIDGKVFDDLPEKQVQQEAINYAIQRFQKKMYDKCTIRYRHIDCYLVAITQNAPPSMSLQMEVDFFGKIRMQVWISEEESIRIAHDGGILLGVEDSWEAAAIEKSLDILRSIPEVEEVDTFEISANENQPKETECH